MVTAQQAPSDAELFAQIVKAEPPDWARPAKRELYQRHAGYLYAVLSRKAHRLLSSCSWSAEDLLQETFARAFERANTFHETPGLGPDQERRRTRAWLGTIAQHLLADSLRAVREVATSADFEQIADPGPPSSGSAATRWVQEALELLTERERDVLRVSALYLRVGESHQRLPNQVAAELAARWGTTNDNVRAIRRRALTRVREYVQAASAAAGGEP
ncbi:MAG: sigma-70 family RNA polymerase sigma factor [Polyangiaceae bacterium]|nr:sigma-70 family RNA polymerase sigma factor [Polyangiaceae bacterium]